MPYRLTETAPRYRGIYVSIPVKLIELNGKISFLGYRAQCPICGAEVDRLQIGVYLKSKTCNKKACRTEWRNKKSLENYYKIRNSDKYEKYKIKHRQWWYRRKENVEQ